MPATTMLDSGYRAFFDINYVLLLGVATSQPNLVKIGHEMREWHQCFEIQYSGHRHVGFLLPGNCRYHRCFVIHSRNISMKFGENC